MNCWLSNDEAGVVCNLLAQTVTKRAHNNYIEINRIAFGVVGGCVHSPNFGIDLLLAYHRLAAWWLFKQHHLRAFNKTTNMKVQLCVGTL